MLKNRVLTALLCVFTIILTITFSIGLPIYVRPFYYAHIKSCDLVERTGMTEQQIKEGYDEVLDYLTLPGKEFTAGDFAYSQEGKSHFEDCKALFNLNIIMFAISLAGIIVLLILKKKKLFVPSRPFGKSAVFTSGSVMLVLFAVIGGLAALDFDKAFVIFHKIFFYGKENWLFDYDLDQIITALPQEFFLNCGILIASSIIIISVTLIVFGLLFSKCKK